MIYFTNNNYPFELLFKSVPSLRFLNFYICPAAIKFYNPASFIFVLIILNNCMSFYNPIIKEILLLN